jgi:hypothetical protein
LISTTLFIALTNAIEKYGIDNVLYMRESDEGTGGELPPELKELTKEAIFEDDFH